MTFQSPIVVATGNPHKVDEIAHIFAGIDVPVVGLCDVADPASLQEPEETGATFEQNAAIKALGYAEQLGMVCLADDSGLVVDALGGAPGIYSARYSAQPGSDPLPRADRDQANNDKLMHELADVTPEARTARFVCCMALAAPVGQASSSHVNQPPNSGGPASSRSAARSASFDGSFQAHKRKLPHWQAGAETYFLTFRLRFGSLAPAERQIVLDACIHWHGTRMIMHFVTVMPDHVHMLMRPIQQNDGQWPTVHSILHSIKSYTANQINKKRNASGSVWQHGYHDRIMRSPAESDAKLRYMQMNPVKAGLCEKPGEYPFSIAPQLGSRLEAGPPGLGVAPAHGTARPTKSRILTEVRGTFEGRIGEPGDVPRGDNGFGYDPLFLIAPKFTRTSAQLDPAEKNSMSHRGAAGRLMALRIAELLPTHRSE